jgi:hypothetical protein
VCSVVVEYHADSIFRVKWNSGLPIEVPDARVELFTELKDSS